MREKRITIIKKEIEYYSRVYNPNCKKVQVLKKKLKKLTK